jgi:hypothetical protein
MARTCQSIGPAVLVAIGALLATLVGCRAPLPGSILPTGHNLVENGGFEEASWEVTTPKGWYATVLRETEQHVVFEWDDVVAHSGEKSVSVAIGDSHPDRRVDYNWTRPVDGCRRGELYELRGWVKTENLQSSAFIVVQCLDETRTQMLGYASTHVVTPVLGNTDWTPVRAGFQVPPNAHEVRIRAGIGSPMHRGGKAWFDDIEVVAVSGERSLTGATDDPWCP